MFVCLFSLLTRCCLKYTSKHGRMKRFRLMIKKIMINDKIKQMINCKKKITSQLQITNFLLQLQWKEKIVDFHKTIHRLTFPKGKSLKGLDVHIHRWINCCEYKMSTLFQDCNTKNIEQNLLSLNTERSLKNKHSSESN